MDVDIVAEAIREAEAATIAPRFRALTDDDVAFKGPDLSLIHISEPTRPY